MLVFDEVQCGVARTGHLYAYEYYGVEPDIMASAKGIGGGFPMGACLATEKAAAGMVIGTHGSTFGGNPLAMAAGQAVFDVVANEEFLAEVRQKGERLRSALEQMIPNHDHLFESVRGVGLMLGVKMKTDSRAFVNYLRTKGLLTVAAGDNVDARASAADDRGRATSASSSRRCRRRRRNMRCPRRLRLRRLRSSRSRAIPIFGLMPTVQLNTDVALGVAIPSRNARGGSRGLGRWSTRSSPAMTIRRSSRSCLPKR